MKLAAIVVTFFVDRNLPSGSPVRKPRIEEVGDPLNSVSMVGEGSVRWGGCGGAGGRCEG